MRHCFDVLGQMSVILSGESAERPGLAALGGTWAEDRGLAVPSTWPRGLQSSWEASLGLLPDRANPGRGSKSFHIHDS